MDTKGKEVKKQVLQPIIFRSLSLSLLVVALTALAQSTILPAAAQNYSQGQMASGQMSQGQMSPMAQGQMMPGQMSGQPATSPAAIRDWFNKYDMVRRQAQMSPAERNNADELLSHGLQVFVPGEEKILAQKLLKNLVLKYDTACTQLKSLPFFPETSGLHRQYFQYFSDARNLFADYLRVQNNLMAKDNNGNSIMAGLMERKANLEGTEQNAKNLDGQLRNRFGIPPYKF
ncbi:MAG: hypothetical protein JST01_02550 [Cyanobacteria bacterium SZAS TMP-1]|nr:hypothetical protein [Cyanobacteria bacterium SZAS TMP-1]